jgi:hypothetical protein
MHTAALLATMGLFGVLLTMLIPGEVIVMILVLLAVVLGGLIWDGLRHGR